MKIEWIRLCFITRLLIIPLKSDFRDSTQENLIQSDEQGILQINSNAIIISLKVLFIVFLFVKNILSPFW